MTHTDQVEDILEQITSYNIIQGEIFEDSTSISLQPSRNVFISEQLEEIEFFNITITEDTYEELETKKKAFLRAKTNLDFDYNDFDARGYISVSDGTDFLVDDAIVGTTSGATGTVYRIVDDVLYLKSITGTWEVEAINGKTATCLSAATTINFPYYIMNSLVRFYPSVNINVGVGGTFRGFIRFEARWGL